MRNQPMPGGRSLWMVTMKLRPVKMELKPSIRTPVRMGTTPPIEVVVE